MLKVLYLPLNSPQGVQQGTYDAWNSLGVKMEIFDFYILYLENKNSNAIVRAKFLDRVRAFKPDLIHMQMQFNDILDAATLIAARKLAPGVVITNWTGDIRDGANKNFINLSKGLDFSLISSTGQLDAYKKAGVSNVAYWQIGFDPKNSYPKNYTQFKHDVCFIANNYGRTFPDGHLRLEAANKCYAAFGSRFGVYGAGFPEFMKAKFLDPRDANEAYNQSVCALSISNFNNVNHYFSDRLLYCVASGRPTISWRFPGYDSYFLEGKEMLFVSNHDELISAVRYCKNNPAEANKIGRNGMRRAFREHTFTSRIIELLKITNQLHKV